MSNSARRAMKVECSLVDGEDLVGEGDDRRIVHLMDFSVTLTCGNSRLHYENCSKEVYNWALSLMDIAYLVEINRNSAGGWTTVFHL